MWHEIIRNGDVDGRYDCLVCLVLLWISGVYFFFPWSDGVVSGVNDVRQDM